jgi:hypothetical protein
MIRWLRRHRGRLVAWLADWHLRKAHEAQMQGDHSGYFRHIERSRRAYGQAHRLRG